MNLITTPVVFGQSPPANSVVHNTSVSLTNRSPNEPVHLVQYDDTLPMVAVSLNSNGQPYAVPSGAAVNVRLAKPDGTYVYNPAYGVSDDGQTVYIAVTLQMTAVSGEVSPIIEVVVNGAVAGTGFFVLDIDPNPVPEDAIESTDEYKTIQQLAAEVAQAVQQAAASATAASNSASAAKESEKAAAKSAEEAKASTPASTLDGMYTAMLDGTNTQKIFKLWWPFAVKQSENKYSCLERFAAMLDTAWGDKTYTVRNIHESVSGDASGTPLDDLADGRSAAPLVTDVGTGVADWAENDPMTWYVRANAKSLADGTMEVLAVETEAAFDVTGETAPVYCFSPALAVKEWDDGSYLYTSWHMRAGDGYVPMAGDVAPDGTHRLLTWHPAFYGGKNSAGGMTSGAGLLPMPWTSANAALPLARKLTAYDGLWCDCDTQFALMAWRLRHWTLSNSGQLEGCTSYNYQYALAAAETGVKRVLLAKAQGANLLAGSCVCLGERGSNTNNDRNEAYNHNVFDVAKILSVETVTVNDTEYAAVNLDLAGTIDTTTTMLVSTMPWPNGTTEALPGHSDGCIGNLTNGRYPYRIAGMEMQIGSYCEELDPLWQASLVDDDHWHYDVYSCRDSEKLAGSITADYQKVGEFDLPNANKWSWNFIRALNKMAAEAQIPTRFGGSSSTYVKAACASPGGAGVFAPWRFGTLNDGGNCGLPCANGNNGPGNSNWNGVPRHADDKKP